MYMYMYTYICDSRPLTHLMYITDSRDSSSLGHSKNLLYP